MNDLCAKRPQDGLTLLEERRLTAHEHGQGAGFGGTLPFGDRRVEHADSARGSRCGDLTAGGRFYGAGDDDHSAGLQAA